jgi:phosphoglycerate dehydrogenase-like enzyme
VDSLTVAVGPIAEDWVVEAILAGGGRPVLLGGPAQALVWTDSGDTSGLHAALQALPNLEWVQLASAGVERFAAAGLLDRERQWTCAKGAFGEPVAEHALMLALAGLRSLPDRVTAKSWGAPSGTSLYDRDVTILGAGGICDALLELLSPFRARATVVRRTGIPLPRAHRTVTTEYLHDALAGALVVFLALALTPETSGMIGQSELARMDRDAWLVNVARGPLVDTAALVQALQMGTIAGAALDVTDPEPLPEDHPLWTAANCIVTPHSADTSEMTQPLLARRITNNVRRLTEGRPLVGVVDPDAGY